MKQIPLRDFPTLKTADIIRLVIERPGQGATISTIRSGCRVLDAIEKNTAAGTLALEDAEHAMLVGALNAFTFGMVSKELLTVIDDILTAQEPPVPSDKRPATVEAAAAA